MKYIEKLQTMQENAKNLENLSKEELIELVELLLKMGISREEGNQYADELSEIVHESKIESFQNASFKVVESFTNLIASFENVTGFELNKDFITKIADGEIGLEVKD